MTNAQLNQRLPNAKNNRRLFKLTLLFMGALTLLITQIAMATETPKYTVTQTDGKIELRTYAPKIVAETLVDANYKDAGSAGFRVLADYIFGNNTAVGNVAVGTKAANEKIAMTAPVIRTKENSSQKIAMTAPVSQTQVTGKSSNQETDQDKWRIQFVMPSKYTIQTLPKPNSDKVTIIQIPQKRYAVISFSGLAPESKVTKQTQALQAWMDKKGLTQIGEPELARYDPPWTLPFLRRNEVMIEY